MRLEGLDGVEEVSLSELGMLPHWRATSRRSKLLISLDYLKGCVNPTRPTRMMSLLNLSYPALGKYTKALLQLGLIKVFQIAEVYDKRCKFFIQATDKGKELIRIIDDYNLTELEVLI